MFKVFCLILGFIPWMDLERRTPLTLNEENRKQLEASPIEENLSRLKEREIPWTEVTAFILSFLGLYYLLNVSKAPFQGEKEEEYTMDTLKKLASKGVNKETAEKLSLAIRHILKKTYGLPALQETSEELKSQASEEVANLLFSLDKVRFSQEGEVFSKREKVKEKVQSIVGSGISFAHVKVQEGGIDRRVSLRQK